MDLSVVIVNWNVKDLLRKALASIKNNPPTGEYEVFVVDNASADGSAGMVKKEFPWATLIASDKNLGFAGGNNLALRKVQGKYVLLLNPDTEVLPGALQAYVDFFESKPKAGALGVKLLNSDRTLQPSCKSFPSWRTLLWSAFFLDVFFPKSRIFGEYEMSYWKHDDERQVDQPMGAALGVRKQVMDTVGLMDEQFYMYFDEVDWCYRIKKSGQEIWFTPQASIVHHWGKSTSQASLNMNKQWYISLFRFLSKHSRMPKIMVRAFLGMLVGLKFLWAVTILAGFGYLLYFSVKYLIVRG